MSTKLNAEAMARERFPSHAGYSDEWIRIYATAINEVAQPIAEERDELLEALSRSVVLLRLLTVRQVIEAGDEAINAAGLNPWCMNEGIADGSERISLGFANAAIAKATTP